MKTAIVNLGCVVTGDWHDALAPGDSILMEAGEITAVGSVPAAHPNAHPKPAELHV